jgi:drug/metabolite transporter (DMT)-like permease
VPAVVSRGVLYMGLAALAFSVMSALVKLAGAHLPAQEIVLARVVVTLVISYALVVRAGLSPWGNDRRRLALRGLLGTTALAGYYWTLTRLPLAEATTMYHIAPVLTAVLAARVLRERIGAAGWLALALGFAGVVVAARPAALFGGAGAGAGGLDPVAVAVSLSSAAASAVVYVTVRRLARTEDPLVIVFYFPLVALPLVIPWAAPVLVMPHGTDWLVLLGVGVATQIAQVFMTMGLAAEHAGRASTVGYLQVAFAMLWGATLFGEWPGPFALIGAGLIVGGTVLVGATRAAS